MNNKYPNLSYSIFNLMGQKLKDGSLSNTENMLSVESLTDGVYFLYLVDKDSEANITKKIIVGR